MEGYSMVPKHNPDIIWRIEKRKVIAVEEALADGEDVSDSGTVTLILSGMMHQLNFVGGKIWAHCDGSNSVDTIAALLSEEFDVEQNEVHADVVEFVADLVEKGWLINA